MKKYAKYLIGGIVLFLIVAQFFPIDKTNPPADPKKDFINMTSPSGPMAKNIKTACYDCHSHHVRYPWYTDVAPISWWVKGHINNGIKHLNFSTWGDYTTGKKNHKLDECIEFVEKNWMPLLSYKIAHPDAKLSEEERNDLIAFFKEIKTD